MRPRALTSLVVVLCCAAVASLSRYDAFAPKCEPAPERMLQWQASDQTRLDFVYQSSSKDVPNHVADRGIHFPAAILAKGSVVDKTCIPPKSAVSSSMCYTVADKVVLLFPRHAGVVVPVGDVAEAGDISIMVSPGWTIDHWENSQQDLTSPSASKTEYKEGSLNTLTVDNSVQNRYFMLRKASGSNSTTYDDKSVANRVFLYSNTFQSSCSHSGWLLGQQPSASAAPSGGERVVADMSINYPVAILSPNTADPVPCDHGHPRAPGTITSIDNTRHLTISGNVVLLYPYHQGVKQTMTSFPGTAADLRTVLVSPGWIVKFSSQDGNTDAKVGHGEQFFNLEPSFFTLDVAGRGVKLIHNSVSGCSQLHKPVTASAT